jgi:hypothetical protein
MMAEIDPASGETAVMRVFQIAAATLAFLSMNPAMAQERIQISSDWGNVTADMADNPAARSLIQMLPITIDMRDHLRQEKTGSCHRRCRRSAGNGISQQERLGFGVPTTLLSIPRSR